MSFISGSFSISFDNRSIKKFTNALITEVAKEIRKILNSNKSRIKEHVRLIVRENLMNSPEVKSIIDENGKLRIELGLENGANDIIKIIDEIVSKTTIDIKQSGNQSSSIDIEIKIYIDTEYVDLYSKQYSSYVTNSGAKVEWLNWLLEAGNTEVVFGYKIKYGVDIGRTGDAIMMPSKTSNWRVPPEFSGVSNNNFITRSFENVDKELLNFIGGIL